MSNDQSNEPEALDLDPKSIDYDDLVILTRYMAEHGSYMAEDIAYAVEKPWKFLDVLEEARIDHAAEIIREDIERSIFGVPGEVPDGKGGYIMRGESS